MNLHIQINKIVKLYQKGLMQEAKFGITKLIKTNSNIAMLHNLLGSINYNLKDLNAAKLNFKKAIKINAFYSEAFCNLGSVLIDMNSLKEAEKNLSKSIQINPKLIEGYISLGKLSSKYYLYDQEIDYYLKALKINPKSDVANNNLAVVYIIKGKLNEAKNILKKVIEINPKSHQGYNNLGGIFLSEGEKDKAITCFEKAINISPRYAEAYRMLSTNIKFNIGDKLITKMEEIYNHKITSNSEKMQISFALGKACNDIKNYEKAFNYYVMGNKIRKNLLEYDLKQDRKKFELINLKLVNNFIELSKKKEITLSKMPIFILGMPRSGTTLTEQIISSHTKVYGGGELTLVEQIVKELGWKKNNIDLQFIKDFRDLYLEKLCCIETNKTYISDKMPGNFMWLGLILSSIPEAKIIHTKRNVQATMWSIYKSYFTADGNGYAYNLNDIYEYYKMYDDFMKIWIKKYPTQIFNLDYEMLTINQEKISRDLIDFLGLEWEDDCLKFYDTKRYAHTASASQVRQKMYQGSSNEWMKYQNFLPDYFKS